MQAPATQELQIQTEDLTYTQEVEIQNEISQLVTQEKLVYIIETIDLQS